MKKEKKDIDFNLIEIFEQIVSFIGNPCLEKIFENHKNNKEELYECLKDYLRGIYEELEEKEEEEEEANKKNISFSFASMKGSFIDFKNISRVELDSRYNEKTFKVIYYIKIVKKYPTPLEEEYIIPFNSEEERNKAYEMLKIKMRLSSIYFV